MNEIIELILLNAISVSRWNEEKTSQIAVLTIEEMNKITETIIADLEKAGYEITPKSEQQKEIKDILECILKFDHSESFDQKGKYFDVIQKDLKKLLKK